MKHRIFNLLKFVIGWPLSLIALFFVIKLVVPQMPQFLDSLQHVSPLLLTASMISFLIYFFLRGYIWKRLVKQAGYNLAYKDTNYIWAASELQRYIPGNIWSFLGRSVRLAEKGMTKKDIAKCTLFEIEFLMTGAAIVPLLSLPFLHEYLQIPTFIINYAPLILCVLLILFIFHQKFNLKLFFLPNYPPLETTILILLNACLFFFFGLGYVLSFASLTIFDPNLVWQLTGIAVLAYLIGYLSIITPSGIGVREGALVIALSKIFPAATAGFIALFGRFILTITEILYVLISYLWEYSDKNIHKRKT